MSFIFSFLNSVLTLIMLFDTLGIIYQFRKSSVKTTEFTRVWVSWLLFLTISSTFSCSRKGFIGTLIRLIILSAKVYVTIPILGGSLRIHKYLIEDEKIIQFYNYSIETIKSKLCKGKCTSPQDNSTNYPISETIEPENEPPRGAPLEE